MERTEAQKKADKKYRMKKLSDGTKKQINATLDIQDYILIDTFCNDNKISKAAFIVAACKEYIKKYGDTEGKKSMSGRETTNTAGKNSENLEEV